MLWTLVGIALLVVIGPTAIVLVGVGVVWAWPVLRIFWIASLMTLGWIMLSRQNPTDGWVWAFAAIVWIGWPWGRMAWRHFIDTSHEP